MLADRLPVDAQFTRDASLGPALVVQGDNAVAKFHFEMIWHGPKSIREPVGLANLFNLSRRVIFKTPLSIFGG